MTVYVDDMVINSGDKVWYHLMSDTEDEEIHNFALKLGLKREWFQEDHYDIVESKR